MTVSTEQYEAWARNKYGARYSRTVVKDGVRFLPIRAYLPPGAGYTTLYVALVPIMLTVCGIAWFVTLPFTGERTPTQRALALLALAVAVITVAHGGAA